MPPPLAPGALQAKLDAAKAVRLQGNDALKQADYRGALAKYHTVLTSLKGLDSNLQSLYPMATPSPLPSDFDTADPKDKDKPKGPKTPKEEIKEVLMLTYLNMSIALLRMDPPKYKRALDCSLDALKYDENNTKAKFRECQARIGLGEITKGKKMLEELNEKNPDVAFQAELRKLAEAEKAGAKMSAAHFQGMYKKTKASTAADPAPPTSKLAQKAAKTEKGAKAEESASVPAAAAAA